MHLHQASGRADVAELQRRRRAARAVEKAKLLKPQKEFDRATEALNRLYEAVERGALPRWTTRSGRAPRKLRASAWRCFSNSHCLAIGLGVGLQKVDPAKIDAFCDALKDWMSDPGSGFGRAYLRLLMDEIRLQGRELTMRGRYSRLADAGSASWKERGWAKCPASA